jgi:hypothetical protein
MAKLRLAVRTVDEFRDLVSAYMKKTAISATRLSSLAVGDARFVNSVLNGDASRVSLASVDRVLTFIENNPKGAA